MAPGLLLCTDLEFPPDIRRAQINGLAPIGNGFRAHNVGPGLDGLNGVAKRLRLGLGRSS